VQREKFLSQPPKKYLAKKPEKGNQWQKGFQPGGNKTIGTREQEKGHEAQDKNRTSKDYDTDLQPGPDTKHQR